MDQTQLVIADAPTEPTPFSFVVMGDTDAGGEGDPSAFAAGFSAQLLPHAQQSRFVLHTGDVTYPVGSYENYLNGFLHPYRWLLKQLPNRADYRADSIVFERSLLPVPGNHDYAAGEYGLWQKLLRGMCDRLRQTLSIDLGHYGGPGGEAYGQTFLDDLSKLTPEQLSHHLKAHYSATSKMSVTAKTPYSLSYRPGQFTRLPNRYYSFRYGGIDFFALDSNTWKTDPTAKGFDHEQLAWLEQRLVQSVRDPGVTGRIIYLHHSPYTTEVSRWQQPETLWVRRHLRGVLANVSATVGKQPEKALVDVVISGHAHCLEHLKTLETEQGDAQMDWVVCGGSGASLRPQKKDSGADILENVAFGKRSYTKKVAESCLYASRVGKGAKKKQIYSFLRVDVRPDRRNAISVVPFLVTNTHGRWETRSLKALDIGASLQPGRRDLSLSA